MLPCPWVVVSCDPLFVWMWRCVCHQYTNLWEPISMKLGSKISCGQMKKWLNYGWPWPHQNFEGPYFNNHWSKCHQILAQCWLGLGISVEGKIHEQSEICKCSWVKHIAKLFLDQIQTPFIWCVGFQGHSIWWCHSFWPWSTLSQIWVKSSYYLDRISPNLYKT